MIFGIDTASVAGNKNIDWVKAKAKGQVSFAIIRSNYGTSEDKLFNKEWPRIQDAGITRGAYLFLRFPHPKHGMKDIGPVAQAKAMCKTVGRLNVEDFPPVLDVEFPGGRKVTGLSVDECIERVRKAWAVLHDYYKTPPIIYTSARVWKEDLKNQVVLEFLDSPLWLARYYFKGPPMLDASKFVGNKYDPPVPTPWLDEANWAAHQYQGDTKGLPGFPTGNLDMNRFNPLVKGDKGQRVRWLQMKLNSYIGGTDKVDGIFGNKTEKLLKTFQRFHSLIQDGIVGPKTFACLCWAGTIWV